MIFIVVFGAMVGGAIFTELVIRILEKVEKEGDRQNDKRRNN